MSDIDTSELAAQIADAIVPVIESHMEEVGGDGLSEEQVKDLIEEAGSGDGLTADQVLDLIEDNLPESSGGEGLGDLEADLRLAFDPENIDEMETGSPDGSMHSSTGWGPVYEAEQRCHLRGATVDADSQGTVTFRFYELADGDMDTDVLNDGDPFRTRKVEVYGGEQHIPLEVTLDEGHYFIEKDAHLESDETIPLRRSSGVDPEDVNGGDAPLNWVRGFHPDYRPSVDEDAYERFQDGDWARNYHYLYLCEVGYSDGDSDTVDENAG